jgi:nitroimidazol reductase NimA-like FMN-containing flavoprotein (pyridoxamine 5'-phosphate oxidase superfamily)
MDQDLQRFILDIIGQEHDLTLATVREDGYPQATTVSYANDGLVIYVGVGKDSQKAHNIRRSGKVSLTIDTPYSNWNEIKGLSMGARAEVLADPREIAHAAQCLVKKFPEAADWAYPEASADVVFLKITPEVISVLDYRKGFGHTETVRP